MIHDSAIISKEAIIDPSAEIGPYCVVGPNVTIGKGSKLHSHVVIERETLIGEDCEFYPFAAIGGRTQDLKYDGEPTRLVIGDRNTFRENTTIHRATDQSTPTSIGNDNLFLSYAHVAHDCQVGNNTIFSNNGTIAGHVIVEDYAIISGLSAVHQFCRVGQHSIVGGCTKIVKDIPPFMIIDGQPAEVRGVNTTGLQRRGFTQEQIREVKNVYKALFLKKDLTMQEGLDKLQDSLGLTATIKDFILNSERGVTK